MAYSWGTLFTLLSSTSPLHVVDFVALENNFSSLVVDLSVRGYLLSMLVLYLVSCVSHRQVIFFVPAQVVNDSSLPCTPTYSCCVTFCQPHTQTLHYFPPRERTKRTTDRRRRPCTAKKHQPHRHLLTFTKQPQQSLHSHRESRVAEPVRQVTTGDEANPFIHACIFVSWRPTLACHAVVNV